MVEPRIVTLAEAAERQRQLILYGDVELDADGRVNMNREVPWPWNFMTVARGFGKSSYLDRLRAQIEEEERKRRALWNIIDDALLRPVPVPEIGTVTWGCRA